MRNWKAWRCAITSIYGRETFDVWVALSRRAFILLGLFCFLYASVAQMICKTKGSEWALVVQKEIV